MAREYYAEYRSNGGNAGEAMKVTLERRNVHPNYWGRVAEAVKNYRSTTVVSIPSKTLPTIRRRLRHVGKTFTEMSLPNGDRD